MRSLIAICSILLALLYGATSACAAPVTVLAPSQPSVEEQQPKAGRKKAAAPGKVDVLMTLMHPFANKPEDMDRPSLFAALYYPVDFDAASMQPDLRNLLGDVGEIRYMGKKAWGANVDVAAPGLYQFILETKPWWDAERNKYIHQQVKTILPVKGGGNGWNTPFGQSFEILPLTRPFGLTAPALFSARVMLDDKPLENTVVRMGRLNTGNLPALTSWHENLEARTDSAGEFAFVLNEPGWWYCEAILPGAPLKGPDGEMKDSERATVLWLYVDAPVKR